MLISFKKIKNYNLTLLSRFQLFYETHFYFYCNDVTGFLYFVVAK